MPHLLVYASEDQLTGRETDAISALTEAVVGVYGEWAREIAEVQLIGIPAGRWGVGGRPAARPAPRVTFGIHESAFARPDADEIVSGLVSGVTEALVSVFGDEVRAGATVELVGSPPGRTGIGGSVGTD